MIGDIGKNPKGYIWVIILLNYHKSHGFTIHSSKFKVHVTLSPPLCHPEPFGKLRINFVEGAKFTVHRSPFTKVNCPLHYVI